MRSRMAVSLCYISLLCMQQMPGSVPLPSPNIMPLPIPREPLVGVKDLKKRHLMSTDVAQSPNEIRIDERILQRSKRRVNRSHPARLMRVGCSLGTCQVQNLNYRLWQLIGQQGKDKSPVHLSSPHGYG